MEQGNIFSLFTTMGGGRYPSVSHFPSVRYPTLWSYAPSRVCPRGSPLVRTGVPQPARIEILPCQDWDTPLARTGVTPPSAGKGYVADGMPRAVFRRRTFLLLKPVNQLQLKIGYIFSVQLDYELAFADVTLLTTETVKRKVICFKM